MWSAICRAGRPLEASGPSVEDLEHSRYFLTEWMPPLLRETAERSPPRVLADLGAGDGGTLWPLDRAGLVGEAIYAVDISTEHVALCERLSPKVRGIVSDLTHVDELEDGSVDAVVSSQVIEHLPDDMVLAPEIARILRSGGWFYVSSVIRGHADLELDVLRSSRLKFPLTDPLFRIAAMTHVIKREQLPEIYLRLPRRLRGARRALGVPIPGYRWVEATGRKQS